MNTKLILGISALLVVVGVAVIFIGRSGDNPYVSKTVQLTQSQNQPASESTTKKIESVTLASSGFEPQNITVKAGTKVTWINKSGSGATVNSAVHPTHLAYPPLNLGSFDDGETLTLVFDTPGTYKYHNHLNPSQTGVVVVE